MPRHALFSGCFCALTLLIGCDPVAELIGVDEFDVNLGDDAAFPLVPTTNLAAPTAPVALDVELPDVFDIARISIPQSGVSYTPLPGGEARCDVKLYVLIDRAPALQATVTLDEAAGQPVQEVISKYARPYDRDVLCEGLEDCPVASRDLNEQEIRDRVDGAVDRGSFDLDFIAANPGACAGALRIETLHFELDF